MRAQVDLVVPDDDSRFLMRVRLNDDWVGDLLFCSTEERDAVLGALTSGDVSVVTQAVPLADFSVVDAD